MIHLNWFSPLPPAETDIAHYTARLLPALAQRCSLTLWTDVLDSTRDPGQLAEVRTYDVTASKIELPAGGVNFFHIGNNRKYHQSIFRLAHETPGVIVLHDLAIPNLAGGLPFSPRRKQPIGPGDFENALAFFTHTKRAFESWEKNSRPLVAYHPLPYPAHARRKRRTPSIDEPKTLIIFGHLGVNRRLEVVLDALQNYGERQKFRLEIYGRISKQKSIERAIRRRGGLQEIVRIHGFVPEEKLDAALERADLAINLRFPTMGEASGSQLRIWDHALPSLVTRGGWYADLPAGTVAYVEVENEVRDLHQHFDKFLVDPDSYAQMGERGRQELEQQHSPESYADAIVALATKVRHRQ